MRVAKINSARLFFLLASFFETIRLRMTHPLNIDGGDQRQAEMLALGAFELGRQFQVSVDQLKQEFDLKLKELVRAVRTPPSADDKIWEIPTLPLSPWPAGQPQHAAPMPFTDKQGFGRTIILDQTAEKPTGIGSMTPPSPAWHTLRDGFLRDKPALGKKAIWSYDQAFAYWTALIGDKPIGDIRRPDVKLFADFLRDRQNPRGGALNQKTIVRSLGNVKTFMGWAVSAGMVVDDRFETVQARDMTAEERMAEDPRRAFTAAEMSKLFESSLFTNPGDQSEKAAGWFLAIAALTGARTEEIAQVPAELVWIDNVCCLDFRKVGKKTRAAPRLVPLLGDLLNMGLVEWAGRQAALGYTLVQPETKPRTSAAWSKFLNRYINDSVADDPTLVLYSLRHSFRQMLRAGNIGDELADKIFAHSSGKVGASYGRNLSPDEVIPPAIKGIDK
nr:hypothetical protein [Acidocella aquatica]